jgi:glycosyltransferase involved in cell wall biosynthesis
MGRHRDSRAGSAATKTETAKGEDGKRMSIKISCVCYTHGRAHIIGEAVESYLRQLPCGVDTELLIVNDCPEQPLACDQPGVRVENVPMCKSVCEKFNVSMRMAAGEYIAVWEDDDISLPWRLARSVEQSKMLYNYKQLRAWFWNNGKIDGHAHNLFFGNSFFRKSDWFAGGGAAPNGYPDATGHAAVVEATKARHGQYIVEECDPRDLYWIYRWGGVEVVHDSGFGEANNNAETRMQRFRARTLSHPQFRPGLQVIEPHWKHNYIKQAMDAAEQETQHEG